jgi:hypothetical protein
MATGQGDDDAAEVEVEESEAAACGLDLVPSLIEPRDTA